LGVPTTRSLAVVKTGELVFRESALPGAVLTRVASSHIRVGTFQYLAAIQDNDGLMQLADYAIARHYPGLQTESDRYLSFLTHVMKRQAELIAKWLQFGFIHGVMNTDNMAISGETIDYGPCAFLDRYHPNTVFSSIDQGGRYAYGNQPTIAHWNLVRLAEAMLPLFHDDEPEAIRLATHVLETFPAMFDEAWLKSMGSKLGLADAVKDDRKLIEDLLQWMADEQLDFTSTFRDLMSEEALQTEPYLQPRFVAWKGSWKERLARSKFSAAEIKAMMSRANPAVIPRNHHVEQSLEAATRDNDLEPMHKLLGALSKPFEETEENGVYRQPPEPSEHVYQTFCGT
jgi:serine/tyrosine/threonine adenylyltransferase